MLLIRFAALSAAVGLVACDDTKFNTGGEAVSGEGFDAVLQVMEGNCTSCHSGSAPSAGLDLSRDTFCDVVLNGELVVPGDSAGSLLVQRIEGNPSPMPPAGLMEDGNVAIVADWVDAGADCTSSGGGSGGEDTGTPADGASIFASSCAGCHGANGEGVSAPSMDSALYGLNADDVAEIAMNGTSGGMPAILTDADQAALVADYCIETWGN